jgi:hypothetical protein
MSADTTLRPLERRVLRLVDEGVPDVEIARRFRRSPDSIRRIVVYAGFPASPPAVSGHADPLRPLERRVIRWRDAGSHPADIGPRFRRSAAHIERVETWARAKLARASSTGGPGSA